MTTSVPRVRAIGLVSRVAMIALGVISWTLGGVATFRTSNGAATSVLIIAGLCALMIGLMGRWPERVSISGTELAWAQVDEVVDSQIEVAKAMDASSSVVAELLALRRRLDELQATGRAPDHPAVAYDRLVESALRRVWGEGQLLQSDDRASRFSDYLLSTRNGDVFIETKWQPDPSAPLRARSLPRILHRLPPDARLLVITNASDVEAGRTLIESSLGNRGRIVSWQGRADDPHLSSVLRTLVAGLGPRNGPVDG